MAQNIFEQYGIKEVADVQFEALETNHRLGVSAGDIVMYLDTLKISTVETTADQTEAKGGKGAPPLIIWDFGREITVSLQDALFTPTSLALMCGAAVTKVDAGTKQIVRYTEEFVATMEASAKFTFAQLPSEKDAEGKAASIKWLNLTKGTRGQLKKKVGEGEGEETLAVKEWDESKLGAEESGDRIRVFYDIGIEDGKDGNSIYEIVIDAKNFPGTYRVYGDTVVRNRDGKDTPFQFVINRAKVGSETTFTMEAEGDPSVFDMSLRVLRDDNGDMIKFIKYELGVEEE